MFFFFFFLSWCFEIPKNNVLTLFIAEGPSSSQTILEMIPFPNLLSHLTLSMPLVCKYPTFFYPPPDFIERYPHSSLHSFDQHLLHNDPLHNSLHLILHFLFTKLSSLLLSYSLPHSVINISVSTQSSRHYERSKQKASPIPVIKNLTVHTERWVSDQLIHQRRKKGSKNTLGTIMEGISL